MPAATSFKHPWPFPVRTILGEECLEKVNVSIYDYYTTLGGTQKGVSPTEEQIALSLENAMKIFWNFYEMTGRAFYDDLVVEDVLAINTEQSEDTNEFDFQFMFVNVYDLGGVLVDELISVGEPINRVCYDRYFMRRYDNDYDPDAVEPDLPAVAYMNVSPIIVRMYAGSTGDEENFIGYGVKPNSFISYAALGGIDGCACALGSYQNDPIVEPSGPTGYFNITPDADEWDIDYVTVSEIPFVGTGEAQQFFPADAVTFNSPIDIVSQVSTFLYARAKISGLEFYTY